MNRTPKIGHCHQRTFVVESRHLISFADQQMPAVLSTPSLVAEMERTAREAAEPFLDENERTVGVELDISHLAPGLEGMEVVCTARVLGFQDGEFFFQIEARDALDLLCRGVHRRRVVDVDRLARRVAKKREAASSR